MAARKLVWVPGSTRMQPFSTIEGSTASQSVITSIGSRVRSTMVRESSLRTFASGGISRVPTTTRSGWRCASCVLRKIQTGRPAGVDFVDDLITCSVNDSNLVLVILRNKDARTVCADRHSIRIAVQFNAGNQ